MTDTTTVTVADFKPGILVQYEGGGHEGCMWEWNFAWFKPNGEFVNLGCTGRNGCETLEQLEEYYRRRKDGEFYLTDLNDKASLTEVPDEINVDFLIGIAKRLKEEGHPVDFQPKCSECGSRFSIELALPTGLGCDGGIHYSHREIICQECQESYTCCDCGEYAGIDGMTKGSSSCKYCDEEGDD